MTTLFLITIILVFAHFVYESSIAPSIRMVLRYKMFEQRDKLRLLKLENNKVEDNIFEEIDDVINHFIYAMPIISISHIKTLLVKRNFDVSEEDKTLWYQANNHEVKELKEVLEEAQTLFFKAFIINSWGFFIYILPLIFLLLLIFLMRSSIKNIRKSLLFRVASTRNIDPEDCFEFGTL